MRRRSRGSGEGESRRSRRRRGRRKGRRKGRRRSKEEDVRKTGNVGATSFLWSERSWWYLCAARV